MRHNRVYASFQPIFLFFFVPSSSTALGTKIELYTMYKHLLLLQKQKIKTKESENRTFCYVSTTFWYCMKLNNFSHNSLKYTINFFLLPKKCSLRISQETMKKRRSRVTLTLWKHKKKTNFLKKVSFFLSEFHLLVFYLLW